MQSTGSTTAVQELLEQVSVVNYCAALMSSIICDGGMALCLLSPLFSYLAHILVPSTIIIDYFHMFHYFAQVHVLKLEDFPMNLHEFVY